MQTDLYKDQELNCDVLVAGGGPAGVATALAAARCGAKTVLVQDRPMLGGNASSEVRMHIVGADGTGNRSRKLELEAREGGILEEVRLELAVSNPQRSASMMDYVLYDKCRREPNLTVLLNSSLTGAEVVGERIVAARVIRPSTEDRFRIVAKTFVDCTGDGALGAAAGAPFMWGREAKAQYAEKLGADVADKETLGATLLFMAKRMDKPVPFTPPPWARKFSEADLRLRPHASPANDAGLEYGYWWMEWGGKLDTIKDGEKIRDELMAIMMGVWDHLKNGGAHGAENWALEWFGFLPGKRESRRFVGQYLMREADLLDPNHKGFEDTIAFGGWPIDTHPPGGVDAVDEPPCCHTYVPYMYDVPLRACVSAGPKNLMFAGRNISATHVAFASTRVMGTCFAMGQGVGTAAALALEAGVQPADIAANRELMRAIQQRLLRDDAYLINVYNEDPADLARKAAKVSATSEVKGGEARNVISGQTRAMEGEGSVPTGRSRPGTNRWMSDPKAGLPAALTLEWSAPVTLREIRLTFDSGLHRLLTLTPSAYYIKLMEWGAQPETVRDYVLEGRKDGKWVELERVSGNYQRLRSHVLGKPATVDALRVSVTATQGAPEARITEVRAYA